MRAQGLDRVRAEHRLQGLDQIHAGPELALQHAVQRRRHRLADDEIRVDQAHALGQGAQGVFATFAPLRLLAVLLAQAAQAQPQRAAGADRQRQPERQREQQAVAQGRDPQRAGQDVGPARRRRRGGQGRAEHRRRSGRPQRAQPRPRIVCVFRHGHLSLRCGEDESRRAAPTARNDPRGGAGRGGVAAGVRAGPPSRRGAAYSSRSISTTSDAL